MCLTGKHRRRKGDQMTYEKVIEYCKKHNLSIHAFEKMCGLKNATVCKWEGGKSLPRMATIKKIADATKTSVKSWV